MSALFDELGYHVGLTDEDVAAIMLSDGEEIARLEHLLSIARDGLRSVVTMHGDTENVDVMRVQARARRALERSDPAVKP